MLVLYTGLYWFATRIVVAHWTILQNVISSIMLEWANLSLVPQLIVLV